MTHKTAGRVARPRVCARCKGPISEIRPVFLIADNGGKIVGPYHAGCAERVKLDNQREVVQGSLSDEFWGMIASKPTEEGEPW